MWAPLPLPPSSVYRYHTALKERLSHRAFSTRRARGNRLYDRATMPNGQKYDEWAIFNIEGFRERVGEMVQNSRSALFDLGEQVAIVTGGTGVLGGAIARGLALAGGRESGCWADERRKPSS
jgi:hypothetical protein